MSDSQDPIYCIIDRWRLDKEHKGRKSFVIKAELLNISKKLFLPTINFSIITTVLSPLLHCRLPYLLKCQNICSHFHSFPSIFSFVTALAGSQVVNKNEPMFISRSEAFKFAVGDVITLPCEVTQSGNTFIGIGILFPLLRFVIYVFVLLFSFQ